MKIFVSILIIFSLRQFSERQKQYTDGLKEVNRGRYKDANEHLQRAYNMKPDSRIAYWMAYDFAQEDSIQECLFYLSKALEINPKVLDSSCLNNIDALKSWAKERDYNTYVKFSLSLSYKSAVKNFPVEKSLTMDSQYFLRRVVFEKDTIPPPIFRINRKFRKEKLDETN
jgi:tetratricopeptide (TPR) repeat protein